MLVMSVSKWILSSLVTRITGVSGYSTTSIFLTTHWRLLWHIYIVYIRLNILVGIRPRELYDGKKRYRWTAKSMPLGQLIRDRRKCLYSLSIAGTGFGYPFGHEERHDGGVDHAAPFDSPNYISICRTPLLGRFVTPVASSARCHLTYVSVFCWKCAVLVGYRESRIFSLPAPSSNGEHVVLSRRDNSFTFTVPLGNVLRRFSRFI